MSADSHNPCCCARRGQKAHELALEALTAARKQLLGNLGPVLSADKWHKPLFDKIESAIAALAREQAEQRPVARLEEREEDKRYGGRNTFDIVILDPSRCRDDMYLYAAPQPQSPLPASTALVMDDPKRGYYTVIDEAGEMIHGATWPEACHEHINDAINDFQIAEAAKWKVIQLYAATQPSVAQAPESPHGYWQDGDWYGFSPDEHACECNAGDIITLTPVWTHAKDVKFVVRNVAGPDDDEDLEAFPVTPEDAALLKWCYAAPPSPVASTALTDEPEWIAKLRHELMFSKMTHNFTFSRDEVMQLVSPRIRSLSTERK